MARKVIWLREAVRDLEEIGNYISRDSEAYATNVVKRLYNAAVELKRFPGLGRRVPEWDDERYRERIVYNYRLIYRVVSKDRIEILAFIHGGRLLTGSVRKRK